MADNRMASGGIGMAWQLAFAIGSTILGGAGAVYEGRQRAKQYEFDAKREALRVEAERENALSEIYLTQQELLMRNAQAAADAAASGVMSTSGSPHNVKLDNVDRAAWTISQINRQFEYIRRGAAISIQANRKAASAARTTGWLNAASSIFSGGSRIAGLL